jgi:hypothetical protein
MHFLPVLLALTAIKAFFLLTLGGPRRTFQFVRDCVTVGEDHWTWTTRTGEWFEDAEIEAIADGELILRHRHGIVHLAINALSKASRDRLYATEAWSDYLVELAIEEGITDHPSRVRARSA